MCSIRISSFFAKRLRLQRRRRAHVYQLNLWFCLVVLLGGAQGSDVCVVDVVCIENHQVNYTPTSLRAQRSCAVHQFIRASRLQIPRCRILFVSGKSNDGEEGKNTATHLASDPNVNTHFLRFRLNIYFFCWEIDMPFDYAIRWRMNARWWPARHRRIRGIHSMCHQRHHRVDYFNLFRYFDWRKRKNCRLHIICKWFAQIWHERINEMSLELKSFANFFTSYSWQSQSWGQKTNTHCTNFVAFICAHMWGIMWLNYGRMSLQFCFSPSNDTISMQTIDASRHGRICGTCQKFNSPCHNRRNNILLNFIYMLGTNTMVFLVGEPDRSIANESLSCQ